MTTLKRVQQIAVERAAVQRLIVTGGTARSPMPGVEVRPLTTHRDDRGTLTELLRADWPDVYGDDLPFAQAYVSYTRRGVARDDGRWHVHQRQTDRFVCLAGRLVVPIADAREDSPTRGSLVLVELSAEPDAPAPMMVTVPPGTLHGLIAVGEGLSVLMNLPTRLYDASDEGRVAFADAGVEVAPGLPFGFELLRRHYGVPPDRA